MSVVVGGCSIVEDPAGAAPSPPWELGVVAYPPGWANSPTTNYLWSMQAPSTARFQVEYALAPAARQQIIARIDGLAANWSCVGIKGGYSCSNVPEACTARMDACVFDAEVQVSGPALAELSQRFVGLQQGLHLDSAQIAAVIVAFVQHIRYEVPQNTFGITSPAVIISDNRGDCDSKSLLGYLLLRAVGVQSMVFQSDAHAHAMLGIALPGSGEGWNYDGVTWLATEMTAEGWPMGQMDPEMKEPFDWRAMVMAR